MAAPKTNVIYGRYANGVKLVMRDGGWQGLGTCSVKYVGTEGWVETGDSGAIRVTIARWFTPNDRQIGEVGLTPDVEVLYPEEFSETDIKLEKAIELLGAS